MVVQNATTLKQMSLMLPDHVHKTSVDRDPECICSEKRIEQQFKMAKLLYLVIP